MKPLLYLGLLGAAAAAWMKTGVSEANGGHVHVGQLSGTASLAVIAAGGALVALFIGLFLVRWRQAAQAPDAEGVEDAATVDEDPESLDEE